MFKIIRIIKARFDDSNFMTLGLEALLFSALYGIAFHSWLVFGMMFLGSFWLLNGRRGAVRMIYAMSLLWGFVAFSIGYSINWGWAVALGAIFFVLGVNVHFKSLKGLSSTMYLFNPDRIRWRRNGYEGLQNLN